MRKKASVFKRFKRFWKHKHLTQIAILTVAMAVLACLGSFYFFASKANISALEEGLAQSTVIYDVKGDIASKITANKVEGVSIDELPEHLKNAIISIEDHRFYEHNGVDLTSIGRAFFRNMKAGGIVEGGSTITQQLTKNALLSAEKTYRRKIEEFFLAREIEKKFTKNEILQMYVNQIYFGEGAYGIKRAAMKYYGKELKELTLSESALLAGLIKAPSVINPYKNEKAALERRDVVLGQMKAYQLISEEEWKKAINEKLVFDDKGGDPFKGRFPFYVDFVLEEGMKKYGFTLDELLTGGYHIYTELDPNMQEGIEETYRNDILFPPGTAEQMVQSGAILMDPKNGGVRALVGGRGEHTLLGYNRAIHPVGQPGSTMKPIVPYTPALESGWDITDLLIDEKLKFGDYEPNNYDFRFRGRVPMYEAVKDSLNIPAVWLLNEIGIDKGIESAKRFGIPDEAINHNLSLALGGTSKGVSPLNMAEAYSVFANGGEQFEAHSIVKIVDSYGNTVYEWQEKKKKVTTKVIADKMTTMLLGVVEYGSGKAAQIPGREVAGKTGSTQVPIEGVNGVKDQWFVGYTPQLVGAVWVGYDRTDRDHYLTTTSGVGTAPIFKEIMTKALKNQESVSFHVPHISSFLPKPQKVDQHGFKKSQNKGRKKPEKEHKEHKKWDKKKKHGEKDN